MACGKFKYCQDLDRFHKAVLVSLEMDKAQEVTNASLYLFLVFASYTNVQTPKI